ncbi:COP1-interacting protein 7 isoform X2 [Cajanus cajan]|uniref:COP1-interacting protein 7 isoform X2 n=1 Tax=Cajanus cajan TaxID=3821 RepID=UPI0010FB949A|nr:COP1-interacting protein 7 isoform X2 [Cajanus cajan]
MNSSTRLDSAVFQLTPTRTRFDLVITVNGKKEKVASGLLNPFLSHLKAAQDQIAKGGYSIVLVPEHGSDTSWFTKGTVERFVRFVSTPEILERVYTIESEIAQIEEAIAIQGNNSIGISIVEENQIKHVERTEGRKTQQQEMNEEKAIVLYKSDTQPPETNGSTKSEGNSKVQLLKVLETRKSVLQKEQGMAFARAVAAGFDIDYMPALMSFAECFEASRLMDACRNFISLWKRKHESGQWLEIEAAEVMPNCADFSAIDASGIILSNTVTTSHTELDSESNGKTNSDVFSVNRQPTAGYQDNVQGHFPHNGFSSWPVHSPPGALPMLHPYPVQGIPYYQTYPGNSPFMQPIRSPMEDSRLNAGQNMGHRRHSMDNGQNTEFETRDELDMEREGSQTVERRKKSGRTGRQKSGMVVIRNINYITKTEHTSGSGSCSDYSSETDEDKDAQESVKTSKRRESSNKSFKRLNSSEKEVTECGRDADGGQWLAFQNCLLKGVDEDRKAIDQGQFDHVRRKKQVAGNDPIDFTERNMHEVQGGGATDVHSISKGLSRMPRSSNDDFLLSRRSGQSVNARSVDDVQSLEIDGRIGGYRRGANDDFVILKQDSQCGNLQHSSDVAAVNGQGYSSNKLERKLFHDMNDDSYIVESRSVRVSDSGNLERNAIDMDSEFPKVHRNEEKTSNYQPHELSLMPERGAEKGLMFYDPALDYEMQAQAGGSASQDKKSKGHMKPGSKMLDKDLKSKPTPNSSDSKKSVGPIRRGKTSKLSPLDEARARAERLRNYKVDLQKIKKEKEDEEMKRLNALKMERQKRIAARSNSIATKSPIPSQLTKKQIPTKLTPSPYKGSKFSDSEPGSSSPFPRFPIRTAVGSSDSSKVKKISRLNTGSHSVTNKLSRSAPSLPQFKREKSDGTANTKAPMARLRRLSEPKMSTIRHTSSTSVKPQGARTNSVTKAANETEIRKISAIVNHDKSMTATLPELKINTFKAIDIVQNRSSLNTPKLNVNKSSLNSEGTSLKKNEFGITPNDDGDDNPIIEKTVVMLEREKPRAPNINDKSKEKKGIPKRQYDSEKLMEKTETVSSYVAFCAPVSVDIEISENKSHVKPISSKVKANDTEKEPSKSSSIHITEETYHTTHARVSSLEDRCTRNSEYSKAPPTSLDSASIGMETFKSRVSESRNSTLEKIPEVIEKPQVKESSKGLKRLLKFGRKSHDSPTGGCNMESDNASIDGSEANDIGTNGSSNEVHTLKNLISRNEAPSNSATPPKSSRSFSLLSPFRSNKGKKIMMA